MRTKDEMAVKNSKSIKKLLTLNLITFIFFVMTIITSIIFLFTENFKLALTFIIIALILYVLTFVFVIITYAKVKQVTNNSIIYYKIKVSNNIVQMLIISFCYIVSLLASLFKIKIEFELVLTIVISFCSLDFAIYAFILPLFKSKLPRYRLKNKEFYSNCGEKKILEIKKRQGEIFSTFNSYNSLSNSVVVMGVMFSLSLIAVFFLNKSICKVLLIAVICYSAYVLIKISLIIKNFYKVNTKIVEEKMIEELCVIDNIETKNKNNYKDKQ